MDIRKFLKNRFTVCIKKKVKQLQIAIYGKKALLIFSETMESLGYDYWLMYGTLLGAIREHGFIKHDDDIDIGMFCEAIGKPLAESLVNKGFVYRRMKCTKDMSYRMMTFKFHGISFDIYGFKYDSQSSQNVTGFQTLPLNGKDWKESYQKNLFRVCLTHMELDGLKYIDFEGLRLKVPVNSDQVLRSLYGDDYLIPIKGKKAFESKIIEIMPIEQLSAEEVRLS